MITSSGLRKAGGGGEGKKKAWGEGPGSYLFLKK